MVARLLVRVACRLGYHAWLHDEYRGGFYCSDCRKIRHQPT